jgi:pimeloyl-ACP methyl ester carboxylesterase/AcrR family transcriptional regulator
MTARKARTYMVRPRSQHAHEKVLRAALDLFGERGIEATSMDSIAQSSGVSKATIYNHWANKEALLIEVMLHVNGLDREPPDLDSGDSCADVAAVLSRRPPDEFDAARNRMMPTLIAYSAINREFGEAWRHRVMEPPRKSLRRILGRAIKRGQLPASLDLDLAMALLLGPLLYRHIFQAEMRPETHDIGPAVARAFWRAYALDGKSDAPREVVKAKTDDQEAQGSSFGGQSFATDASGIAAFDRYQAANMETTTSNDGTRIALWRRGSGPPLLLVHGGVCDHLAWHFVTPLLEQKFTVFSYDRRGRGRSGNTEPYDVEREVEDLLAVLSKIDEPAHLLGHSAGGIVALKAAERQGDLLSLMLYEPAFVVDGTRERPGPEILERMRALVAEGDLDEVIRIAMRETIGVPDAEIEAMRAGRGWKQLRSVAPSILNDWMLWEERLQPERLAGLHLPALLLVGSESPSWLQATSRAVLGALPEAREVEMVGQGHSAMISAPELFAWEVVNFVENTASQIR